VFPSKNDQPTSQSIENQKARSRNEHDLPKMICTRVQYPNQGKAGNQSEADEKSTTEKDTEQTGLQYFASLGGDVRVLHLKSVLPKMC
jgi:hypothetical protein